MTNAPRSGLTKAGLVIAVFVGGVAVMLIVLVLRTPVTESFHDWTYPNSSPFATITNSEVLSAVLMTRDNFTNVVNWYSDRVRMGRSGNPSFSGRSRGLFARGMTEQAGRIGNTPGTNAVTETFLIWRHDRAMIVHASWNRDDPYTRIAVTMRENQPTPTNVGFAPNILMNALTPPTSVRGSGGQMVNLAAHAFTDTNSFAALRQFWDQPSALATNTASAQGRSGVATNELRRAQVVRLPVGAAANAKATDLLFITPHTFSLIHVAESSNKTSQLVIGSITR
jgi:hypothetical protein